MKTTKKQFKELLKKLDVNKLYSFTIIGDANKELYKFKVLRRNVNLFELYPLWDEKPLFYTRAELIKTFSDEEGK